MTVTPAHIELREISHTFRTETGPLPVLDNLTIRMSEGSFTAVVGPSGCGKSTLTRLVAGLMKPDEGQVWLGGRMVTSPRKTVGMAFQNPVLLEWRTILDNVILPLEIVAPRMSRADRVARAEELLDLVGLKGFENKRPSELSGGMRQRASLCRSIVHRPEVLILDEPFGALDAFTREDLWQTMARLRHEESFTAILITHDLRESVFLADNIVVLSGRPARSQFVLANRLPADRTLEDLYSQTATDMLAVLRHQIQIAQGRAPADAPTPEAPRATRPGADLADKPSDAQSATTDAGAADAKPAVGAADTRTAVGAADVPLAPGARTQTVAPQAVPLGNGGRR